MRQLIYRIYLIIKRCNEDQIGVFAAQSSFFMLLSAIPLIMLLVTTVQFISPLSQGALMAALLDLVPSSLSSYVVTIVNELYSNAGTTIISISALTILWSASKGVYALELGIHQIYRIENHRIYLLRRVLAVLYTAAFILTILLSLILLVFGNRIQLLLEHAFPFISRIAALVVGMRSVLSIVILTLFFALLYCILANRRRYRRQLPGALFAASGWVLFSFFYSIYIDNYSNYSYIYGSLTALVLLCLWLYVCMKIILIGAELNAWLEETK